MHGTIRALLVLPPARHCLPALFAVRLGKGQSQEGTKNQRFLFWLPGRMGKRMKPVLAAPVRASHCSLLPWQRAVGSGSRADLSPSLPPLHSPWPWTRRGIPRSLPGLAPAPFAQALDQLYSQFNLEILYSELHN